MGHVSSPAFIVQRDTTDTGQPNPWLLATTDGEVWLLQNLDDGDPDTPIPILAAINGTTVLVGTLAWPPTTSCATS